MALTRDIRIKVTQSQFESIKCRAQSSGFKTISSFIRESLLTEDNDLEELLKKIYDRINEKNKSFND